MCPVGAGITLHILYCRHRSLTICAAFSAGSHRSLMALYLTTVLEEEERQARERERGKSGHQQAAAGVSSRRYLTDRFFPLCHSGMPPTHPPLPTRPSIRTTIVSFG
eukprot:COSAG06_NODE_5294_length_3577_cov_3.642919_5_plen_107_part_00